MKTYISASRRTDLPRFFADDFFNAWLQGEITYDGGYGRSYSVSLRPADVLGYIFWSKDFSLFVKHPLFEKLISLNNAVFHYTINDCSDLEPRVAPLLQQIETLRMLCEKVGAERVLWRFDPVCKYRVRQGRFLTNEERFNIVLPFIQKAGIKRCYFSFMTLYAKLKGRSVEFVQFSVEEKKEIGLRMLSACSQAGMNLFNCCNEEIPGLVSGITKANCIDEEFLRATDRFGVHKTLSAKPTRRGCGCFESRDIGSYLRKCPHGCFYCYAHPDLSPDHSI
jgi:hypothetical protein